MFGEDSDFNEGPPSQPSLEPEFENSSFLPTPEPTDRCWIGFANMISNFDETCGEGTT